MSTQQPCPFCAIAAVHPPTTSIKTPLSPSPDSPASFAPPSSPPQTHLLLSTPHVLAFLDHAPISRGHILLATRTHRTKLSDVSLEEGRALGTWLPIVSRAVIGAVTELEKESGRRVEVDEDGVGDWNVVQNNGARAAQVVPHVHFHIIPRVGDVPEVKARSWTVFGKGQREDLDLEDAEKLLAAMKTALEIEIEGIGEREGNGALRSLMGEGGKSGLSRL